MTAPMPKDNEVDEKAVAWLITYTERDGSKRQAVYTHNAIADWRMFDPAATSEPLYSAATVAELRAEVERLQAIEEAARIYYRKYCQDEAGDEPDDDGRGLWTGASAKHIHDASALRDALTGADPT